jgi:hypothetical protein
MSAFDIIAVTLVFIGFLGIICIPFVVTGDDDRVFIWQKRKKKSNSALHPEDKQA